MEREDDIQLIRRILSGDDTAFETLVQKYQGSIHALAWRKIGDFHIAEEITQDTFLQVYKNLSQLRNPNQLLGWMYVIANRLCLKWLEKNKSVMQSLEDTPVEEIERVSYTHHVAEQRETERTEQHHELVKKLLAKLPESERTVVTLYYLGRMTTKEISKFLGVSVNTITSRLQRARKRLQEQQEALIQEVLGGVQVPASVSENIMRQVSEMNPAPAPAPKPLRPWMALGAAAILIALLLGTSNRYLTRFQKPYSFEAQSEPTIEIVDASIILDIAAKPAVRSQVGRATTPDKTNSAGTQVSDVTSTSATSENATKFSTAQWSQGNGPPGGPVYNIFATSDGTVYAVIRTGIYRLTADATAWTRVNTSIPIGESLMPMAEHKGRLYIVAVDEVFASDNRGETWRTLGPRPTGDAVELVITDTEEASSSQVPFTMYLALGDNGIFRSTDGGAHWRSLNDGLAAEKISAMTAIEKTVFAGTEDGLYRLDSGGGVWEKLPLDTSGAVCSLAPSGNNLYAGVGHELLVKLTPMELQQIDHGNLHFTEIFHSTDLGALWTEIRLGSKHLRKTSPAGITVLARGKTLLALSYAQSRSTDGGQTWTELEADQNFLGRSRLPAIMVDEITYYKANFWGIHRTTDGGASWHIFMNGMMGAVIIDLVAFNNRLYAHTGYEVYQSTDGGVSWKKLWNHGQEVVINIPTTRINYESKLIPVGNVLYSLSSVGNNLSVFRLSTDSNMLIPVQGVPVFDRKKFAYAKYYKSKDREYLRVGRLKTETAAASRDTFYVEFLGELFKWKLGDSEWTSTGLVDGGHLRYDDFRKGFKLAVLGETIYVGKRDSKLFQSLDEGESWRDVTPRLPLRFTRFNDIVFVESTLYVATDNGVMASKTAEQWLVLTDSAGERPIINRFATDGSKVYGIGDAGGYRLDMHMQWEQISSEVPDEIISLAITNNRLYGAVKGQGIFHTFLVSEER